MAIKPIPVNNQPKVFDSGISGWNGTWTPVTFKSIGPMKPLMDKNRSHAANDSTRNTQFPAMRLAATSIGGPS